MNKNASTGFLGCLIKAIIGVAIIYGIIFLGLFAFGTYLINDYNKVSDTILRENREKLEEYKKKAEAGDTNAMVIAGKYYKNGRYAETNYPEAVKFFRKAAELGNYEGQYQLGCCYVEAAGVSQNFPEALKWFCRAALNDVNAKGFLAGSYTPIGRGSEYFEFRKWFRDEKNQTLPEVQYAMGLCHSLGLGVDSNYTEAVKWFRQSAEQGYSDAQLFLGVCYLKGLGVEKNDSETVKWIRKSAEQGNSEAQAILGEFYEKGISVEKNLDTAIIWYKKSAAQGYDDAKESLKRLNAE